MQTSNSWQPCTTPNTLRVRAAMLATSRKYFAARDVLEVETPTLVAQTVTDPHIQSVAAETEHSKLWLRTSPEYHMKRILAAYPQDIYQIAKVFRDSELGNRHQPEFTMIEWYRLGFSLTEMIKDTCELITALSQHGKFPVKSSQTVSYVHAFTQACNLDPFTATVKDIKATAKHHLAEIIDERLAATIGNDRSAWLDLIASHIVVPSLEPGVLHIMTDYPAEQAMLARLNPDNKKLAERFEVFLNGVELANGYFELQDAAEQTKRFHKDNKQRQQLNLKAVETDQDLLLALESGLPSCSGVAVGLDRLLMVTDGHNSVASTLSFLPGG